MTSLEQCDRWGRQTGGGERGGGGMHSTVEETPSSLTKAMGRSSHCSKSAAQTA